MVDLGVIFSGLQVLFQVANIASDWIIKWRMDRYHRPDDVEAQRGVVDEEGDEVVDDEAWKDEYAKDANAGQLITESVIGGRMVEARRLSGGFAASGHLLGMSTHSPATMEANITEALPGMARLSLEQTASQADTGADDEQKLQELRTRPADECVQSLQHCVAVADVDEVFPGVAHLPDPGQAASEAGGQCGLELEEPLGHPNDGRVQSNHRPVAEHSG